MYLRISLALFIFGGMLCYFAWKENELASSSLDQPETISLTNLIARGPNGNANIILTDYELADNFICVEDKSSKKWNKVWVPIVPIDQGQEHNAVEAKNAQAILYSTHAKSAVEMVTRLDKPQLSGMVINSIEKLGTDEKNLLEKNYPDTNFDRCLIIEEGREPASSVKIFALLGGGVLLIVGGAGTIVLGFTRKSQ